MAVNKNATVIVDCRHDYRQSMGEERSGNRSK